MRTKSRFLFYTAVFLGRVCACWTAENRDHPQITPTILLKASCGMSQAKLESLLEVPARHQFTVLRSNCTVRCISYQFNSYATSFFFVFTNDALEKIALRPDYESAPRGWRRAKRARWRTNEPDERLDVVLKAPALTSNEIVLAASEKQEPGVDNALSAFIIAGIIAAPVIVARTPERIAKEREVESLAKRYDPYRMRLGMSVEEVEKMLEKPHFTETLEDGSELRYYGSNKLGYYFNFHWLCTAFRNGRVTAVFSDDFCNQRKLEKRK
jgi:hypothetical protein